MAGRVDLGITRFPRASSSSFPRAIGSRFPAKLASRSALSHAIEQLLDRVQRSAAPFFLKVTLSCPPKSVPSSVAKLVPSSGLPLTRATSHESPSVPSSASRSSHESLSVTPSVVSPQAPLASPSPQASHEERSTRHLPSRLSGNAGEATTRATAGADIFEKLQTLPGRYRLTYSHLGSCTGGVRCEDIEYVGESVGVEKVVGR